MSSSCGGVHLRHSQYRRHALVRVLAVTHHKLVDERARLVERLLEVVDHLPLVERLPPPTELRVVRRVQILRCRAAAHAERAGAEAWIGAVRHRHARRERRARPCTAERQRRRRPARCCAQTGRGSAVAPICRVSSVGELTARRGRGGAVAPSLRLGLDLGQRMRVAPAHRQLRRLIGDPADAVEDFRWRLLRHVERPHWLGHEHLAAELGAMSEWCLGATGDWFGWCRRDLDHVRVFERKPAHGGRRSRRLRHSLQRQMDCARRRRQFLRWCWLGRYGIFAAASARK